MAQLGITVQIQGNAMAGNGDMKAHEETYADVMTMLKWGTAVSVLTGLFVILVIST